MPQAAVSAGESVTPVAAPSALQGGQSAAEVEEDEAELNVEEEEEEEEGDEDVDIGDARAEEGDDEDDEDDEDSDGGRREFDPADYGSGDFADEDDEGEVDDMGITTDPYKLLDLVEKSTEGYDPKQDPEYLAMRERDEEDGRFDYLDDDEFFYEPDGPFDGLSTDDAAAKREFSCDNHG